MTVCSIEKLRESSAVRQADAAKAHKSRLAKNEKRIDELDRLFRKIYEDNAIGILNDERFEQMSAAYDKEQAELKESSAALNAKLEAFAQDNLKADKSSGEHRQKVDIYLRYIGKFTIPGDEPKPFTPEEAAAEVERLEEKRRKNEYLRLWRAKKKAKRLAAV